MGYSRYGSKGKGLSDRGSRRYARGLASRHGSGSKQLREYTTFLNSAGQRVAKGSWQAVGMTAVSMGFGTGMEGYRVTGDTGLSGYEFISKYQHAGYDTTGNKLYLPYEKGIVPKAPHRQRVDEAQGLEGVSMTFGMGTSPSSQYGRVGYPSWLIRMLKGSELGLPPKSKSGSTLPVGLALIALKVLL